MDYDYCELENMAGAGRQGTIQRIAGRLSRRGLSELRTRGFAPSGGRAALMHKQSDALYEDAMIAATALVHGLTVVTRNTTDFKRFNVKLFNPFGGAR